MRRFAPFIIVGLVAALAIGAGVIFYRAKMAANPVLTIPKENTDSKETGHVLGPAEATVTLEEYGDFQCPPCGKLSEPINELQKKHNLRIIFRQFPLPMHAHAREAACASEAAGLQGRFWQMHDLLFKEQGVWSTATDAQTLFAAYAGMLQLDIDRFKRDIGSSEVIQKVDDDQRRGGQIGVRTTPTIFLNNQAVPPEELQPEKFTGYVETAIKNAKPSS